MKGQIGQDVMIALNNSDTTSYAEFTPVAIEKGEIGRASCRETV